MPSHKIGSWQPYIPKLGSSIGCRSGVRNQVEEFNIQHISKKYQDTPEIVKQDPVPSAAECAFIGGSFTMKDSGAAQRCYMRGIQSNAAACTTSLGLNLVPTEETETMEGRAHRGKSSQESKEEFWNFVTTEPDVTIPVKSRCNAETMKPLDNLGAGLDPRVDRFMDATCTKKLLHGSIQKTSLGPGMIPVASSDEINCKISLKEVEPNNSHAEYVRKYGTLT